MNYYRPYRRDNFERQISSFDETRYDAFQSRKSNPQFQGSVQMDPSLRWQNMHDSPGYLQPQKKSQAKIWIIVILFMLALGAAGGFLYSTLLAEMIHPRPTSIEEVHSYNLTPSKYNSIENANTSKPTNTLEEELTIIEEPAVDSEPKEDPAALVARLNAPVAITDYLSFPASQAGYPMPYYRSFLGPTGQVAYDRVVEAMLEMKTEVLYPDGISLSDNEFIIDCVRADHPEIFWVDDTYTYYTYGDDVVSLELAYIMDKGQRDDLAAQVEAVANDIVTQASGLPNEYAKVRYYYEKLSEMLTYDYNLDNLTTQTVVGAFVVRTTACAGYARAMQYLCYKSNIPCVYVLGYCSGSEEVPDGPHAWNAMICDGTSFYTDVTWGDTDSKNAQLSYTYAFLGLTLSDISATSHSFKFPEIMPKADDPKYEEWILQNTALGDYQMEYTANLLIEKFSQGQRVVYLRFPNEIAAQSFWNDFTGPESAGGHYMIDTAPWLIGTDDYYHHYAIDLHWMNVVVYMWTDA